MLYKQHSITHHIPSGTFQLADLKKLIDLSVSLHADCVSQLKQDLLGGAFRCDKINANDPNDVDAKLERNFQIMIEIFGDDGEYVNILKLSEVKSEVDLPHKFSLVRIVNAALFEYNLGMKPSIYFDITVDFKSPKVFDLISTPSKSTANDSRAVISGQNTTMVKGISSSIDKFFVNHKSYHGFIHAENVYDLLLWLGFFPLLLVFLYKYQARIPDVVTSSSTLTQVLTAFTVFFILALTFRLLFNLGRWLFPYMQIKNQVSRGRLLAKAVYSLCVAGIVGAIAVHVVNFFWEALVK